MSEAAADLRRRIVAEASSWVGTPFHDGAGLKNEGVDCVHLLIRVFAAVGIIEDFEPEPYSPQWFQHRDEPRFLRGLENRCARVEVALPGDIAMYSFGRHAAHSAIIIDSETLVHAWKPKGRVILDWRRGIEKRLDSYWSAVP